jgi:hypothetical protein
MGDVDPLLRLPHGAARRWIDGHTVQGRIYDAVVRLEATNDAVVTWGEFREHPGRIFANSPSFVRGGRRGS